MATRHGKRADGIVVVTVPMSKALKNELKALASQDHLDLAPFIRTNLSKMVRRSLAQSKRAVK